MSHMLGAHGASVFCSLIRGIAPVSHLEQQAKQGVLEAFSYLDHHRIICFWLYLMLNCHSTNLNLHMGRFLFLYKLFQISRQTTIVVYVGSIR